jgi:hypothetical protein
MRIRALSVLGLFLAAAGTCEGTTEPPPDTCVEGMTLTIATPRTGAVAGGDCVLPNADGRHGDSYTFSVETQSIFAFNVTGTTETGVRIRDNSKTGEQQEVAFHDNGLLQYGSFVTLMPGSYTLDIAADEDGASGDYSIGSSIATAPQPSNCVQPPEHWRFAMIGTTTGGAITSGDCAGASTFFVDAYNVMMLAGSARKITVTMSAGGAVEVRLMDSPTLVTLPVSRNTAGDNIVNFTPPTTGYYNIAIIAAPGTGTITYTIKIE